MAEEPGLGTFVGRVRGQLPAEDHAWVESTSHAIEDLRADLVDSADRLTALARRLDPQTGTGPFVDPDPDLTAWEQLVAWADEVNSDLVELAARGPVDASPKTDPRIVNPRLTDLGRLLQAARGEQLVDELLMGGLLVAPPGTTSTVAFADHGAWDIEFLGRGGATIARADVVITGDADQVLAHLASRPGVDLVYTTTDAADGLVGPAAGDQSDGATTVAAVVRPGAGWPREADGVVVVDLGSDMGALHSELSTAVGGPRAAESVDALLEAVPVLALLVVGARTAARAAATTDAGADVANDAWQAAADVVTSAGVSGLVGWASGLNLLKVPATVTFSLGRTAVRGAHRDVELSARRVARARRLLMELARLAG